MSGHPLLPVADAQARLLALASPVAIETAPLVQAARRWAAADVAALRTQPACDLSAMDGYAIRFDDLPGPWRVIGESAAGHRFADAVAPAQSVRIFTGAPMPDGADCVLVQEEAARNGDRLTLAGEGPGHVGRNVRPRGLDFHRGDLLVAAGDRLTAQMLALVAVAGHASVTVRRRVRVAIAATGDELEPPGSAADTDRLPESNGVMLSAMLQRLPVDVVDLGILPDRLDALTQAFASVDADILVTTGGASVGDHDLVRPALAAAGAQLAFWRVALRPGKPMLAGRMRGTVVLGLPGNPVSAFVTATLFLHPLIAAMSGARDPMPATWRAIAGVAIAANGPRADYLRAVIADGAAVPADRQDSSMLRTLARSNCLIVRAPHAPALAAGDPLDVVMTA